MKKCVWLKGFITHTHTHTHKPGNTKGRSIIEPLTSCLTGLNESVLQINIKIFSCHTVGSKPVKEEVNGTMILPPLLFPTYTHIHTHTQTHIYIYTHTYTQPLANILLSSQKEGEISWRVFQEQLFKLGLIFQCKEYFSMSGAPNENPLLLANLKLDKHSSLFHTFIGMKKKVLIISRFQGDLNLL